MPVTLFLLAFALYSRPPETALEKPARGALFSAVQRQLSRDSILIVDSLNYIKGFRYQMYCAAREMKLRTCTVRPLFCTPPSCVFDNHRAGVCRRRPGSV